MLGSRLRLALLAVALANACSFPEYGFGDSCQNGIHDPGEIGVDCGGSNCKPCGMSGTAGGGNSAGIGGIGGLDAVGGTGGAGGADGDGGTGGAQQGLECPTRELQNCDCKEENGGLYFFCSDTYTFIQARNLCMELEANLVILETPEEGDFLFVETGVREWAVYWAGGSDLLEEGVWRWENGVVFYRKPTNETIGYVNWNEGEPDGSSASEDCLSILVGGWEDKACGELKPVVCEQR